MEHQWFLFVLRILQIELHQRLGLQFISLATDSHQSSALNKKSEQVIGFQSSRIIKISQHISKSCEYLPLTGFQSDPIIWNPIPGEGMGWRTMLTVSFDQLKMPGCGSVEKVEICIDL